MPHNKALSCGQAHGYAVAVIDPRGAWLSGGDFHHNGIQEAEDCADAVVASPASRSVVTGLQTF